MRIAVITGASSGMGREFVRQLPEWERFDEYWVIARRGDRLEALREETGLPLRPICLDLTEPDAFAHYEALLKAASPEVGLLANISGFGKFGSYADIPLSDSLRMIDLNCKAPVALTEFTLQYMKAGAKILELDSLSAFQPVPYLNVYASTKAFLLSYSRALGRELKSRGIRVMAVNPGWVKTEFFEHATQTSQTGVTYFNKLYEAKDVMHTALRHLYRTKKDVSIHGLRVRLQVGLVKLLPHRLVMNIWLRQQGHK